MLKSPFGAGEEKNNAASPLVDASGKKSWCYYPHWSRDSVSPLCGIFLKSDSTELYKDKVDLGRIFEIAYHCVQWDNKVAKEDCTIGEGN